MATYRGHASMKILNRTKLWFCVYYVLKVGGVFLCPLYVAIKSQNIIDMLKYMYHENPFMVT